MLKNRVTLTILLTGLMILTVLTACPTDPTSSGGGGGGEPVMNATALQVNIAEAERAKEGVLTGTDASDVAKGRKWVTYEDMNIFESAINEARYAYGYLKDAVQGAETQQMVIAANTDLSKAINTFKGKIKTGTRPINQYDLSQLINDANSVTYEVTVSADGKNVSPEQYWVTQSVMTALNNAIDMAQSVQYQGGDIDNAFNVLNTALYTFIAAKKQGTLRPRTITISGLDVPNGTQIEVGLFQTEQINEPVAYGSGIIQNKRVTVTLDSYASWNGNGSYYVAFTYNQQQIYISKSKIAFSDATSTPAIAFSNFKQYVYRTTAGEIGAEFGVTIPTTGLTLDQLCQQTIGVNYAQVVAMGYIPTTPYKDEALTQPFRGSDRIYPNTIVYGEYYFDSGGGGGGDNGEAPVPSFNPVNTTTLTANTWANGNINTSGGVQWFRFTATSNTQYIHVKFGTLDDLYVQVYNNSGNKVGNCKNFWSNSPSPEQKTLNAGQQYYIVVWTFGSYNSGTYQIAINNSSSTPPGGNNNGNTYTVSFDRNGGSGTTPYSQTVSYGSTITLPSGSGLYKSGYTFGGWTDYYGYTYDAGSYYTVYENTTLYANWVYNETYTVYFDRNGGSGTTPSSQTASYGNSIILPGGSGLYRSGYTFGGWIDYNTWNIYDAGSYYTVYETTTLYANWVYNETYIVYFDRNGGSGTTPSSQMANYGNSIILPSGSGLYKSGYTFGGWTDYYGYTYDAGSYYTVYETTTLWAWWISNALGSEENPIPLTANTWADGSITSSTLNNEVWYSFSVTGGYTYYVWWNDGWNGDGTKTVDVQVEGYYSNGTYIYFIDNDSAWSIPQSFTANSSDTVKIKVVPYNVYDTGTFAIVYSTSDTRP